MSNTATERRKHFETIVKKAEQEFANNPKGYKNKLRNLAFFGYGYLFFILLLCLGFLGVMAFFSIKSTVFLLLLIKNKLIFVVLVVVYVIFRSLMVRIPPPQGYVLTKKKAPEVFASIEAMQQELKTPKIHEIIVTPELNAAIQQTPRLGIFGWQKNTLILGAELLMVLNTEQTKAVIAHEMGHLSGGHSRFNGWIYRLRMSWMNILHTVGYVNGVARWVFGKFFAWYAPYFNAYSFALARANEYEADAIATRITSGDDLSEALVTMQVVATTFSEDYWEDLEKKAFDESKLSIEHYVGIRSALHNYSFTQDKVEEAIYKGMKLKANLDDTHPSLKDRITAVNGTAVFAYNPEASAARAWFGAHFDEVLENIGKDWVEWNSSRWYELHERGNQAVERLQELDAMEEMRQDDMVEKANIHLFLGKKNTALKVFKQIFDQDKSEPNALYHLGSELLDRNNTKGIQLLQKLMANENYMNAAGERLYAYYQDQEMEDEAEHVLQQLEKQYDIEEAFYDEISHHTADDIFRSIELSKKEEEALKVSLQKIKGIDHTWIATKKINTQFNQNFVIIVFELSKSETEESVFSNHEGNIDFDGFFFYG